jgi:ankyrin repeat protein
LAAGPAATRSPPRAAGEMTKLSIVLKQDEVLNKFCGLAPASWLKLRRTSRLFMWRLDDTRLHVMQQQLIDELQLVFADLHETSSRGDVEAIWLLISQGVSVKLRDPEGATLLQKATHSGKTPVLKLLVEKGANLNAKGAYGYTPLHEACYIGHPEVCAYLLAMKANPDALSKNGSTPLLVAAREGHTQVVTDLLTHSADADDGGDKGWTPLAVAAGEGHLEVCQILLKYNASVHGFSGDGRYERSALQEASEQGHAWVVQLLLEHKADVHHTFEEAKADGQGQGEGNRRVTAHDLATANGHTQVIALLEAQK